MKLEVVLLDKQAKNFIKVVAGKARRLAVALAGQAKFLHPRGKIEVYLINSRRMRNFNRRFRGQNRSTNVLAFPKPKDFPGEKWGEVYLDPSYIKKYQEDLDLMLVHGVLHILGYDHKKRSDRIKMEKKEKQLLSKL